jgi:hypothetical protein
MRENTPFSEMIDTETDDDGVQCTYRSILVNNLGDELGTKSSDLS